MVNRAGAKVAKEEERIREIAMTNSVAFRMRNGLKDEKVECLIREIIGASIEVHRTLGPGYLESVYEEALCVELRLRGIPFGKQVSVTIDYKGQPVGSGMMDIVVGDAVVVELKAVEAFAPTHTAQVLSYLKATRHRVGLPINFNAEVLRQGIKRVVLSNP
jgi:GxxExxY protein